MPFQMGWHKENRIAKVLIYGDVTLAEVTSLDQEISEYLNEAELPVHILFDATQVNTFPTNVLQLREAITCITHPQLGWIAFIDDGSPSNPLLNMLSQLLGSNYRAFGNVKMGLDFIKSQDASLGGTWSRRLPLTNPNSLSNGF